MNEQACWEVQYGDQTHSRESLKTRWRREKARLVGATGLWDTELVEVGKVAEGGRPGG
jgi:hypothetical protein